MKIINDSWFICEKKRYVRSRAKWKETQKKLITVFRPQKGNNSLIQQVRSSNFWKLN